MKPRFKWRMKSAFLRFYPSIKNLLKLIGFVVAFMFIGLIICWAIFPVSSPIWTGFLIEVNGNLRSRTLWEWQELLIIPLVLAIIAIWFNKRSREAERELNRERSQEQVLEAYFDMISDLLLNHGLYTAEKNDDVRFIARARTLATLRQLDGNRKGIVLKFLYSADLIRCKLKDDWMIDKIPIVALSGADLTDLVIQGGAYSAARLNRSFLQDTDMANANLNGADLSKSVLVSAWLVGANLGKAKLQDSDLSLAFLIDANLEGVDFSFAKLKDSIVTSKQLASAKSLEGCVMPNGEIFDPDSPLDPQCEIVTRTKRDDKVND